MLPLHYSALALRAPAAAPNCMHETDMLCSISLCDGGRSLCDGCTCGSGGGAAIAEVCSHFCSMTDSLGTLTTGKVFEALLCQGHRFDEEMVITYIQRSPRLLLFNLTP
jgi:hypothetical protein